MAEPHSRQQKSEQLDYSVSAFGTLFSSMLKSLPRKEPLVLVFTSATRPSMGLASSKALSADEFSNLRNDLEQLRKAYGSTVVDFYDVASNDRMAGPHCGGKGSDPTSGGAVGADAASAA